MGSQSTSGDVLSLILMSRFASNICAAFAAQFCFAVTAIAAVPVEESVEEPGGRDVSEIRTPVRRAPDRPADLNIPPTIEPPVERRRETTEDRPIRQQTQPSPVDLPAAGGEEPQLGQLFYQLQLLQQEVQNLRGQVEEQTYLINRLQRDQQEQYLDLDKRIVALYENRPEPGPGVTPAAPVASTPPAPSGTGVPTTEREAYDLAYRTMEARDYERAMAGFQQLIEDYPNGQYTPNAYYWIGELHLANGDAPERARQSFSLVINLYPDHQKARDALFKLGVVYHALGDIPTAQLYLDRVQQEHPGTTAARAAAEFAAEMQ